MNEQNSYYAFISYNSADEKWAKWLQHNLEYYHIPSALCKEYPELPKKIRPVFWYKQDLSGTKLKKALNNELSSSKYLIVICSPDSAKADWVNDEVEAFIEQGKGDRIIPFIVAGTPHAKNIEEECFPPALRNLTRDEEIRGIDVRRKEGKSHALVDVIATMFGVRFDALWQRHERRRKIIRNTWIFVIALILSLCSITYLRMSSSYIYYADIVACNGFPCGIKQIDEAELRHRYVSYKFVYRRKNFFDTAKKLIRTERINSYNLPTEDCPSLDCLMELGGYIKNQYPIIEIVNNGIVFCDKNSVKKEQWEYMTLQTSSGTILLADIKRIEDRGNKDYTYIFERNTKTRINRYCYELDKNGYATQITYHAHSSFNLSESNCKDNLGAYGYTLERDCLHRIVGTNVIGSDGRSSVNNDNIHSIKLQYLNYDISYIKAFDIYDNPTSSLSLGGIHCISNLYDEYGNSIETNSYDNNLNLVNNIYGYARQTIKFRSGRPIEISNYNQFNERTNNKKNKCSKAIKEYDKYGRVIRETTYDVNDSICLNNDGWAIIEYEYDSNHNIIKRSVYDVKHNPTLSKLSNYAILCQEYDEKGRVIFAETRGTEGSRINNKEGYCVLKIEYNNRLGNISSLEYFNKEGNPTLSKTEGFAKLKFDLTNDRNGNSIATYIFYGVKGEPVYEKQSGAHKITSIYDLNGNCISVSYYNVDNKRCLNSSEVATCNYHYDKKGRLCSRTFLDSKNQMTPLLSKLDYSQLDKNSNSYGGFAKDSIAYISDNLSIIYRFNDNGELCDGDFCSAIESIEIRKDSTINSFYDANFNRLELTDGYAIRISITDSGNQPIEVIWLNKDSVQYNTAWGASRLTNHFDIRGNLTEQCYYDKNNKLVNIVNKFAKIKYIYDNRDNQVACYMFDRKGKPLQLFEHGFGILRKYDAFDRVIEKKCVDTKNAPYLMPKLQYSYEKYKYDEYGNIIECAYFDEKGNPVNLNLKGPHMIKNKYDEYHNCIETRYFDTDSAKMINDGYHCQITEYTGFLPSKMSFYDVDKNCINILRPFYDAFGNVNYVIDRNENKMFRRPFFKINDALYVLLKWRNWDISQPANNYLSSLYNSFLYIKFINESVLAYNINQQRIEVLNLNENAVFEMQNISENHYITFLTELKRAQTKKPVYDK